MRKIHRWTNDQHIMNAAAQLDAEHGEVLTIEDPELTDTQLARKARALLGSAFMVHRVRYVAPCSIEVSKVRTKR